MDKGSALGCSFPTNELKSKQKPVLFVFFHNDIFCSQLDTSNTVTWKQNPHGKQKQRACAPW